MKKGMMILSLGLVVGMVAYAGTFSLPMMLDSTANGVAANGYAPAAPDTATWVNIKSGEVAGTTTMCTLTYSNPDGTAAGSYTFNILGDRSLAFRAAASDPAESPALMSSNRTGASAAVSATITWAGASVDGWACSISARQAVASYGYTIQPY